MAKITALALTWYMVPSELVAVKPQTLPSSTVRPVTGVSVMILTPYSWRTKLSMICMLNVRRNGCAGVTGQLATTSVIMPTGPL